MKSWPWQIFLCVFCGSVSSIPTGAELFFNDSLRIYKAFQVYEQLRKDWNCFDRLGTYTGTNMLKQKSCLSEKLVCDLPTSTFMLLFLG